MSIILHFRGVCYIKLAILSMFCVLYASEYILRSLNDVNSEMWPPTVHITTFLALLVDYNHCINGRLHIPLRYASQSIDPMFKLQTIGWVDIWISNCCCLPLCALTLNPITFTHHNTNGLMRYLPENSIICFWGVSQSFLFTWTNFNDWHSLPNQNHPSARYLSIHSEGDGPHVE